MVLQHTGFGEGQAQVYSPKTTVPHENENYGISLETKNNTLYEKSGGVPYNTAPMGKPPVQKESRGTNLGNFPNNQQYFEDQV